MHVGRGPRKVPLGRCGDPPRWRPPEGAPPSLPCDQPLTFFRTTNSFSAVALRATSSSYLGVGETGAGAWQPSQLLGKLFRGSEGMKSANVILSSPWSILCIVRGPALSQPGLFHPTPAASGWVTLHPPSLKSSLHPRSKERWCHGQEGHGARVMKVSGSGRNKKALEPHWVSLLPRKQL